VEKVVYGGSSLRRWVRTVARSGDRGTLVRGLARGVRDGVLHGPRRTEDVLSAAVGEQGRAV